MLQPNEIKRITWTRNVRPMNKIGICKYKDKCCKNEIDNKTFLNNISDHRIVIAIVQ